MATQVILLERVDKLGAMGDVVSVKPGYARNFLLPQKKALRASKENIAYFEGKKKHFEAENEKLKKEAEKLAKNLDGLKVPLVRQASESGQLYGSVNSRDIADQIAAVSKEAVTRQMVDINQNFKMIGLFTVSVILHPEVRVNVTVNIARSSEEAKIQAETGRALVAEGSETIEEVVAQADEALENVLEDSALEAANAKAEEGAAKAEEDAKKAEASAKKAAEKAAKKAAAEAEEAAANAGAETAEEASEEE